MYQRGLTTAPYGTACFQTYQTLGVNALFCPECAPNSHMAPDHFEKYGTKVPQEWSVWGRDLSSALPSLFQGPLWILQVSAVGLCVTPEGLQQLRTL